MAKFNLTPAQQAAVTHRGRAALVSAAAGSGKTRVLTERLMGYVTDPEHPVDVDRFLIITFTRAAAAELRSRILDSLSELEARNPGSPGLRRQTALCYKAQIGTIHSFCGNILRENCHFLGLRPDFKVMEEDRAALLRSRVLDRLLEERYADIDTDDSFRLLVDTVGAGRDDARLTAIVLELHQKLLSHPWPRRWAADSAAAFRVSPEADLSETLWGQELLDHAVHNVRYWAELLDKLLETLYGDELTNAPIIKAYGGSLVETRDGLYAFLGAAKKGWDAAAGTLPIPFPRLGSLRNSPNADLSDEIKEQRKACKKLADELAEQFARPSAELNEELLAMAPAMEALLELTLEFDRRYGAEKARQGFLDFSDLEHKALELLYDPVAECPTPLAETIAQRFEEIMIDEYQDVNRVQELIFNSVSKAGRNLFMVGDVKQSIYRFRLADPGIFIEKYRAFSTDPADTDTGRLILLQENFRSRNAVLRAANHVFQRIMSLRLGEIAYDDAAALRFGAAYYTAFEEPPVQLSLIRTGIEADEDDPMVNRAAPEPVYVARQIRALVDSGFMVHDGAGQRPIRYSDIAILLRAPGVRGGLYSSALEQQGVPAAMQAGPDFFSSLEVSVLLSLLSLIDNPHQDIPLISVLRSPLFGFTPDDLSAIRAETRDADFYSALLLHARQDARCRHFVETLDHFRAVAPDLSIGSLLWRIYDTLDVPALFSALSGGGARRDNLMALYEYARSFEQSGYRGLFQFVAWMRRTIERGDAPRVAAAQPDDAVQIMSIHKSKGLEFPVVFLADMGRGFNKTDAAQTVLVHPLLGLGPKYTDPVRRVEYPTVARRAIARRIIKDALSEEMRVLYVAMTRARERLYISAGVKDPEKQLLNLAETESVDPAMLERAANPSIWLTLAAGTANEAIEIKVVDDARTDAPMPGAETDSAETAEATEAAYAALRAALDYRYPTAEDIPSKLTATELKRREQEADADPEAAALLPARVRQFRSPAPGSAGEKLSAAHRGTATHTALQHMDYACTHTPEAIRAELRRMTDKGFLTAAEAEAVDEKLLHRFFASPLGCRIRSAKNLHREFRFSLLCKARDLLPTTAEDEVMLQGMVDLYFEEDGQLVVVDYKTDRVRTPEEVREKADYYSRQLQVYAAALSRITGLPVREAVLFFLRTGDTVPVSLD